MRLIAGYVLILVGFVFVQSKPVVRQTISSPAELLGLDGDFDEFLGGVQAFLSPDQYQAFQEELFQLVADASAAGEPNTDDIQMKFMLLLQKYIGSDFITGAVRKKRQTISSPAELLGIDADLDEFLGGIQAFLPPDQYQAFLEEFYQLIADAGTASEINPDDIQMKFMLLLQKYLGSDFITGAV